MEFQMRNKTFISSMVLSVACVSAANAGVVDPFTDAQTAVGVSSVQFININGGLFNQRTLEKSGSGSGSIVGGTGGIVNFAPNASAYAFTLRYRQDASETPINLSTIASMSFDLTASVPGYQLEWVFTDSNDKAAEMVVNSVQTGTITFTASNTDVGFNWASVVTMNVGFSQGSSSTGVLSNFNYTVVPAPGALALLGVAGIVGARRRRA